MNIKKDCLSGIIIHYLKEKKRVFSPSLLYLSCLLDVERPLSSAHTLIYGSCQKQNFWM